MPSKTLSPLSFILNYKQVERLAEDPREIFVQELEMRPFFV